MSFKSFWKLPANYPIRSVAELLTLFHFNFLKHSCLLTAKYQPTNYFTDALKWISMGIDVDNFYKF